MTRWWIVAAGAVVLAIGLGQVRNSGGEPTSRPLATSLAAKVPPDVEELAGLAAVGNGGEAFEAMLKLRTVGDQRAVGALEGVLADHIGRRSMAVHGFAAAQALFCIGTPQAKEALSRYLLSPDYRADMGISYAFVWEMPPDKRDAFIEEYHLKSTSKDLTINLQVQQGGGSDEPGRLDVTVTICNVSGRTLAVPDPKVYLADMLMLRMKGGHFLRKNWTALYELAPGGEAPRADLAPGKCRVYTMTGQVRRNSDPSWSRWTDQAGGDVVVYFRDVSYFVGKPGTFTIRAMLCSAPPARQGAEPEGAGEVWSGRVVSQPVEVEIRPVIPGR